MVVLLASCAAAAAEGGGPGVRLYHQLRELGLDPARVYQVRELAIDRADIHITLNSGTLAFSQSVDGRVTGAFFNGDGDILLLPPTRIERASMALFTRAAILEEGFSSAFFRFTDDTFERLQPALRPAEDAPEFIAHWNPYFRELCSANTFALMRYLTWRSPDGAAPGSFWSARIAGRHLGSFDVLMDSQAGEHTLVGQNNSAEGAQWFDIWTSFTGHGSLAPPPEEGDDLTEVGSSLYRISAFKIRTEILPSHELQADAALTLQVNRSGARTLVFELSRNLQVSSVTADGAAVEFLQNESLQGSTLARRGNDLVAVILPEPLHAGQKMQLRFLYRGSVLTEAGSGLLYVGARGTWYPNLGPGMADYDLEFRSPPDWTLVATGKRVSAENSAGGQVSHWVSERPIPMAGFNLGKFVSAQASAGSTLVETFATHAVESGLKSAATLLPDLPNNPRHQPPNLMQPPPPPPPPSPAHQAEAVSLRCARAVEILSRELGPFPFGSLAITQLPGPVSQGYPGLVFLSSYAFLNAEELERQPLSAYEKILYADIVEPHETAHQWWGDAVLWKSYRDGWLPEALANYSALLVLEQEKPAVVRKALEQYRLDLLRKTRNGVEAKDAGPVTLGHRLNSSRVPDGYEIVCYGRGTWLLHMLRTMFHDADRDRPNPDGRFLSVLRSLRERFDGRSLSTRDLQKAFEEALPASLRFEGRKSLAWFFEGWVNGTALPRFELSGVKFARHDGSTYVSGKLLQKDAPETLVTSVPLYAVSSGRENPVYLGRVFADGPDTTFQFPAPANARSLLVDPYGTVLTHP